MAVNFLSHLFKGAIVGVLYSALCIFVGVVDAKFEPLLYTRDLQLINCPWDSFESQVVQRFENGTVNIILDIQHAINDGNDWIFSSKSTARKDGIAIQMTDLESESLTSRYENRHTSVLWAHPVIAPKLWDWFEAQIAKYGNFMVLIDQNTGVFYGADMVFYPPSYILEENGQGYYYDTIQYDKGKVQRTPLKTTDNPDQHFSTSSGLRVGFNNLRIGLSFGLKGTPVPDGSYYLVPGHAIPKDYDLLDIENQGHVSAWQTDFPTGGVSGINGLQAVTQMAYHKLDNIDNGTKGAAPECLGDAYHRDMYNYGLPATETRMIDDGIIRNNYSVPFIRKDENRPMTIPIANEKYTFNPVDNTLEIDWMIDPANFGTYTIDGRIRALVKSEFNAIEDVWYDVDVDFYSIRVGDVVAEIEMEANTEVNGGKPPRAYLAHAVSIPTYDKFYEYSTSFGEILKPEIPIGNGLEQLEDIFKYLNDALGIMILRNGTELKLSSIEEWEALRKDYFATPTMVMEKFLRVVFDLQWKEGQEGPPQYVSSKESTAHYTLTWIHPEYNSRNTSVSDLYEHMKTDKSFGQYDEEGKFGWYYTPSAKDSGKPFTPVSSFFKVCAKNFDAYSPTLRNDIVGPWLLHAAHYFPEIRNYYEYEILTTKSGAEAIYTSPFAVRTTRNDTYSPIAANKDYFFQENTIVVKIETQFEHADKIVPEIKKDDFDNLVVVRKKEIFSGKVVEHQQLLFTNKSVLHDDCDGLFYHPANDKTMNSPAFCYKPPSHCMRNTVAGLQGNPSTYKPFGHIELAGGYETIDGKKYARARLTDTNKLTLHHPRHLGLYNDTVYKADGTVKYTRPSHLLKMKAVFSNVKIEEPFISLISGGGQIRVIYHEGGTVSDQAHVVFEVQNTGKADGVVDLSFSCEGVSARQLAVKANHVTDLVKPGETVEFGFNLALAKSKGHNPSKLDGLLSCRFKANVRSKPLWTKVGKSIDDTLYMVVDEGHLFGGTSKGSKTKEGLCKYTRALMEATNIRAEVISMDAPYSTINSDGVRRSPKTMYWNTNGKSARNYSVDDWADQEIDWLGIDEMYLGRVIADGVLMLWVEENEATTNMTDTRGGVHMLKVEQYCSSVPNLEGSANGLKFGTVELLWNTNDDRIDAVPHVTVGKGTRQAINFQLLHMNLYTPGSYKGQDLYWDQYDLRGQYCDIIVKAPFAGNHECDAWNTHQVMRIYPFEPMGLTKIDPSIVTLTYADKETGPESVKFPHGTTNMPNLAGDMGFIPALSYLYGQKYQKCSDHVEGCIVECEFGSDMCSKCRVNYVSIIPGICQSCEATYGVGCGECNTDMCTRWMNCVLDSGFCRENLITKYGMKDKDGRDITKILTDGNSTTCTALDSINTPDSSFLILRARTNWAMHENSNLRKYGGRFNGFTDYLTGVSGPAFGNRKLDHNMFVSQDGIYDRSRFFDSANWEFPTTLNNDTDVPRNWIAGRVAAEAFYNGRVDYGIVGRDSEYSSSNNYMDVPFGEVIVVDKVQSNSLNIRMQAAEWAYHPTSTYKDPHVCRTVQDYSMFTVVNGSTFETQQEKFNQLKHAQSVHPCAYCPNNQQMSFNSAVTVPYTIGDPTLSQTSYDIQEDIASLMAHGTNYGGFSTGGVDYCIEKYGTTKPFGSTMRLDYHQNPKAQAALLRAWNDAETEYTNYNGATSRIEYFEKLINPFCELVVLEAI
eukprot:CFRG0107T1